MDLSVSRLRPRVIGIRGKLLVLGVGSVALTAGALVLTAAWQSAAFSADAQHETQKLIDADMDHITASVYNLVKAQDQSIQQEVDHNLAVAVDKVAANGGLTLDGTRTVEWTATNQFTQLPVSVTLPAMDLGGTWIGQTNDLKTHSPVVDDVKALVGG